MLGKSPIVLAFLALALGSAQAQTSQDAPRPRPAVSQKKLASPGAPEDAAPVRKHRVFDISREGKQIGTEIVDITRQGDTLTVKTTTHISVVVMFIQAYRFDHAATEVWNEGKFTSYKAVTDDNGTKHVVSIVAKGDKLALTADGEHREVDGDLIPASLWNKAILERTGVLDSNTGKELAIKVADLGEESLEQNGATIKTHHYKISGDLERDVWFEGNSLVRLRLFGSDHSTIISALAP